jgi:hypothetical protein
MDRDSGAHGGGQPRGRPRRRHRCEPERGIDRHERDHAERQVELPRERHRDERRRADRAPGVRGRAAFVPACALVRQQSER